ncbi:MAG TPA: ABC transporter ATP-binding protein [Urbifossiella sp.]|jgi:lipopolysaccharide transport system ATP-binding protein|nr:ABC transporter ATP-binding protein [Urbifossiella sp.]
MAAAIRVEGLGKRYRLVRGEQYGRYRTLRESLVASLTAPFRRGSESAVEEFWALTDVSFEIQPGEVVGVVGRNGAGKSTLLKVLSRIAKPTTGRAEINGRVGSLLEVGTGFHPELTGRENVFLNGSILGMGRLEIARKFDEIVAFAEVEKFLDMPVKRYSSGMYVRLAFAVAAHLEPEVLMVDEVLAVGDAVFQRRCIDRMTELARSGRALVFVSHQLDIVKRFCRRGILLDHGRVVQIGPIEGILDRYREGYLRTGGDDLATKSRSGHGKARFTALRFLNAAGQVVNEIISGEDLRCVLEIDSTYACPDVSLAIVFKTPQGARVVTSWTEEVDYKINLQIGINIFECMFQKIRLRPGQKMIIDLWMYDGDTVDLLTETCVLDVVETTPMGFSTRPDQGPMLCDYVWSRTN